MQQKENLLIRPPEHNRETGENPLIEERADLGSTVGKDLTQSPESEVLSREEVAGRIALIGDSIGNGISGAIKKISQQHEVIAVSGARLQEGSKKNREISTSQLEKIDPKKTPYLVIQGGTNDLGSNSPEVVAERLKTLYQKAIQMGFEKVVIVTIPPHKKPSYTQKVLDTNAILREMAKKGEIIIYDLYEDYMAKDPSLQGIGESSVHPSSHGYEILGDLIVDNFAKKPIASGAYAGEVGGSLATGAEAVPSQETSAPTEHQSEESQKLQKDLQTELEKLAQDEALRTKDEETLKNASIKDIRFNTALLNSDENKVQEEMRRRLSQYTTKQPDGGLTLNYSKFNELSGLDHEMGIGLGEIMPPEYTRILVVTSVGRYRFGTRAVTIHKGVERIGYNDEATGSYSATHTGDTVYVLDPAIKDEAKLNSLIIQEKQASEEGKSSYSEADHSQTDNSA
ncbi:MAG: SGNH/GDSL hydrolase family protein, partial [Candidatus Gracilibacteria bacterium]|nr:SGNH/GDSL hydrolase family protein [Candidatus Gracilibacteria bacterium]